MRSETASAGDADLERFVAAQAGVFEQALAELEAGRKRSHWMWFIFPQLEGLGSSAMAERYAIRSRAEAEAYLAHPVLGPRLLAVTRAVLGVRGRSLGQIFGSPDDLKFRSSMTLFGTVAPPDSVFAEALRSCCEGRPDGATLARLGLA